MLPYPEPAPLDYDTYNNMIKHLARCIGMNPADFSTHSMRRGGSTFLWLAGATTEEIKKRGDWSSDAYQIYLTTPLEERIARDVQVADTMSLLVAGHK